MLTRATKLGNSFSQRCEFIFYFGFLIRKTGKRSFGSIDKNGRSHSIDCPNQHHWWLFSHSRSVHVCHQSKAHCTWECTSPHTPIHCIEKSSPSASSSLHYGPWPFLM